jgi:two-component sensor histidine kinase
MTPNRNTDRYLAIAIVAVLLFAVAYIVHASNELRTRQLDLAELTLERTQQMFRLRLDGLFHEFSEDLREEAVVLHDTMMVQDHQALLARWRPLLSSHWSLMAIRLADEHGNEVELSRDEDSQVMVLTREGSKELPPIALSIPGGDTIPLEQLSNGVDIDYDPRQRIWFGKALENTRDEPTWNIKYLADTLPPRLQVSMLMRSSNREDPFRIIEMDVDLSRSSWIDTRPVTDATHGMLLMDGRGQILRIPDQHKDERIARAEELAAAEWTFNRLPRPFSITVDDRQYRVLVVPYALNGLTLYTATLMDVDLIAIWTGTEKRTLIIMAIMVVVLALLLAWMAIRKRKEAVRSRRQAQRSRTQEKKLAKALGEREVLNREVHHRVKNNLQVVSSLLNLQATRLDDGPVRNEFIRGKKRIDLIALVHHKLYGLKDLRNVDINSFFRELIAALAAMHHQDRTVSFEVDTDHLHADQDTAIELGIILCELVSNCFQHAFPYATGGHVDIGVRLVENDLYRLVVKDNGQGLSDGYAEGPGKLGLEIVDALAEQLDGSFHVRQNGGVTFEVLFRMSEPYADPLEA